MQTTKATSSSAHRASPTPDSKPVQESLPAPSLQPSSLSSRSAIASLFPDTVQPGPAALAASPKFKPVAAAPTDAGPDAAKSRGDDGPAAPATNAGMKRARDGKDGPEPNASGTVHKDKKKLSEKQRASTAGAVQDSEADGATSQPAKRARKGSKSVKSDKARRSKPADDRADRSDAQSPGPKTVPPLALPTQPGSSDAAPASPTSWKHGAQSPRGNAANRASITLAPRRNSNAGAAERPAPARQAENPPADKPVAANATSSSSSLPGDDFAFSACDLDNEGVMHVVSDRAGKGGEQQGAQAAATPGQAAVPPEMTALMDELDAALDKPIGM